MDEKTALVNLNVDENLRIITIPKVKNVFGVKGDIEVNRLTFSLPRYYSGFDMSEFSVRVNYVNANKEANYYEVNDVTFDEENIMFSWLMGSDVTAYVGDVKFSIKLYKKHDSKVIKVFNTKSGVGTVYEGLDVEDAITPEEQQTLLEQIEAEIKEDLNAYTEEKLSEIQNSKNEAVNSIDGTKTETIAILDNYKTATAGYAKTAKTCADSTAADRQAVQTLATQVTADKAIVADHAAKVAEDRTAAETAAQTAQAVADSLPDDYTTAVGKIAENTAEISAVKLSEKELQRRVNALYDIGQGITHRFETDSSTAYAKTIPTGGKLMSVKSVGGRSIVFNQMIPDSIIHVTVTIDEDVTEDKWIIRIEADTSNIISAHGHKVLGKCVKDASNPTANVVVRFGDNNTNISNGYESEHSTEKGIYPLQPSVKNGALYYRAFAGATAGTYKFTLQLFDLTAMFGSGNEPASVEEFEKMFPNDYYPYNAGEIISAGTEEIVEQGKNLFDIEKCVSLVPYYGFEIDTNKTLKIALKDKKTCPTGVSFGIVYVHGNTMANWLITSNGVRETITNSRDMTDSTQIMVACYPGNKETMQSIADAFDIMLVDGIYKSDTMPAYAPFHRNEYPIPETIKALSDYGIEGNVTDYEAKTYTQNNTIDGTAIKALDTPIVTDISTLIPDDFLRNIEVEAGGSVTFKNSNGDSYRIPVPSEEEYIVKLSEVGGTT